MKQPNLFNTPEIHIDKPIRLIELFGGIGAQAMALRDIGADFEHYRLIEFDKYPVASYNAIHGTHFVPQDITKITGKDLGIVDVDSFTYLLTYSFPCQDLSLAGKQLGMTKGKGTRSGLLWEVERLLNEVENLPQVLLMENVPQVHGDKNYSDFMDWIQFLTRKGYSSYWADLNAKDFGVAQNRERCFMVSFLGDWDFDFPDGFKLDKTMQDYLEAKVDEKYCINTDKARKLIENLLAQDVHTERERERVLILACANQKELTLQTVSVQGLTEESATCQKKEAVYLNYNRIDKRNCEVAKTLCARDYKGLGTGFDTINGVVEKWKK